MTSLNKNFQRMNIKCEINTCPVKNCSYYNIYSYRGLQNHMYAVHTPHKDKPFQCKYYQCGKGFSRKDHLARHNMTVHGLVKDEEILWRPIQNNKYAM